MAMIEDALIEEAGRRLSVAAPDADVILFGSRARGEARPDSDLDLLVIEPDFDRRGEEYGRLRRELRGLDVAIDLVIYRKSEVDKWGSVPGSFLHRVLGEGRVSSPKPDLSETARILLSKAGEDATAVREFAGNPEIADSIIGFHAQQAVEKWLKAVTAANGSRHAGIHDIDRLVELVEATGVEVSIDRDRLAVLTQYAVPLRYDELLDAESLEREVLVALVDEVAAWVVVQVGSAGE